MLVKRITTAFILAPLFIWAIMSLPKVYFSYFLLVFLALGAWEFTQLAKLQALTAKLSFVATMIVLALGILNFNQLAWFLLYLSILWWFINFYQLLRYPNDSKLWHKSLFLRLINGFFLLIPMWLALIMLREHYGVPIILLLFLLVWAADIGAYFVGKSIGKHKLAPSISPGKSIEGVLGGVVLSAVVMAGFLQYQNVVISDYFIGLLLILLTSGACILGDLYESLLKRLSQVKDSGQILPGHGGMLDRIDSLSACAPLFFLALSLLNPSWL